MSGSHLNPLGSPLESFINMQGGSIDFSRTHAKTGIEGQRANVMCWCLKDKRGKGHIGEVIPFFDIKSHSSDSLFIYFYLTSTSHQYVTRRQSSLTTHWKKIAHFVNIFYVNNHCVCLLWNCSWQLLGFSVSFASLSVFLFVAFEFQLNFKVLFW